MPQDENLAVGFFGLFLLANVYMIPTWIAFIRGHHQRVAILLVNLLLGWTFLGWVVALVWSATAKRVQAPAPAARVERASTVGVRSVSAPTESKAIKVDEKTCPQCAETVKAAAKICRFCSHEFVSGEPAGPASTPTSKI